MPSYNSEATIERALTSIFEQTVLPSEIIVIDDHSKDATSMMVSRIGVGSPIPIKLIRLASNHGAAHARNVGLDAASFGTIAFLDSDDAWHRRKTEIQFETLENNPQLFLIGHSMVKIDDVRQLNELPISSGATTSIPIGKLLHKNYFNTPTVMMRKTALRFDERLRYSEDYDFWLAAAASGLALAHLDAPLAAVFKDFYGASGLSSSLWKMEKGELGCYQRLFGRGRITTRQFLLAYLFSLAKFVYRAIRVLTRKFARV